MKKNEILTLVEKICTNSSACRGLNNKEVARELMNVAHIPSDAEIVEIPLNWNNQVVILFLIPGDKNYYSLFAGIGNDDKFHFDLSITGILNNDGCFDFFEKDKILEINYFDKKQAKEKRYSTKGGKTMANLSHIFKPGQKVRCNFDGTFYKGTITKTDIDYIIVDIPEISDHCRFEEGFNIGNVYPEYNFS